MFHYLSMLEAHKSTFLCAHRTLLFGYVQENTVHIHHGI